MDASSLQASHYPNHVDLVLTGPLTAPMALRLRDEIETALRYYMYRQVQLRIHSPGGELPALAFLADERMEFRRTGALVNTEAMMQAGSAAAILLSLGEVGSRTVQRCTSLLYHHSRILSSREHALTATTAGAAAVRLVHADGELIDRVTTHLIGAFGDCERMARAGLQRCERLMERPCSGGRIPRALGGRASADGVRRARSAFATVERTKEVGAYVRLLVRRFEQDSVMPLEEASALLLIDRVRGLPLLQFDGAVLRSQLEDGSRAPDDPRGRGLVL